MFEEMYSTDSIQQAKLIPKGGEKIPDMFEETCSTGSIEVHPNLSQSEEDQKKEDDPCVLEDSIKVPLTLASPQTYYYFINQTKNQDQNYFENTYKPSAVIVFDKILLPPFSESKILLLVKTTFENQTDFTETELLNQVMKNGGHYDCINQPTEETLKKYNFRHHFAEFRGRTKEFAFAVVLMKDGQTKFFAGVEPRHRGTTSAAGSALHAEEILIPDLDKFLFNNRKKVRSILIYTLYSPCLKRSQDCTCCMFLLVEKAYQWYREYGIITEVFFTKFWGLNNPNLFKNITYSQISSDGRPLSQYLKPLLRLDSKNFTNYFKQNSKNKQKKFITKNIQKTYEEVKDVPRTIKDHLEQGKKIIDKIIDTLNIHPKTMDSLRNVWEKLVLDSSMPQIRDKINPDFNIAVVKLFLKVLDLYTPNRSPFKLHHIPIDMLE
ncbi:uncharacterized protein LOC117817809 isoform X2 [Notolabrus celidotus]|nr:uncharacterized protein LOC117817809 isoform X2 [Notolabrus celidotus]